MKKGKYVDHLNAEPKKNPNGTISFGKPAVDIKPLDISMSDLQRIKEMSKKK